MPDSLPSTTPPPWINVRPMTKARKEVEKVPDFFRITDTVRSAMQHHIDEVGHDGQRYEYERVAQGV